MNVNGNKWKMYNGNTRKELDQLCKCDHTMAYHAVGETPKGKYCFSLDNCGCKEFQIKREKEQ